MARPATGRPITHGDCNESGHATYREGQPRAANGCKPSCEKTSDWDPCPERNEVDAQYATAKPVWSAELEDRLGRGVPERETCSDREEQDCNPPDRAKRREHEHSRTTAAEANHG